MKKINAMLVTIPTPIGGLALGIASLGLCWENVEFLHRLPQLICAGIAAVILLLLALKFIFNPRLLAADLAHPVIGGVIPTSAMALMIVSKAISLYAMTLAQTVWVCAIVIHITFLVTIIYHRTRNFELHHMVPAWFVPPVGLIVADVSFPGGALLPLALGLLYFGLIAYTFLLPTMLYRVLFSHQIPDAAKPTIAIFAAPASLSLAGYLTVVAVPSPNIIMLLTGIAVMMTFIIYIAFLHLLRLPFSPGYAAFTFPLVISATALFKVTAWMAMFGFAAQYVAQVADLAHIELIIATVLVAYVAVHYSTYFVRLAKAAKNSLS
ncbi:MAG: TDT family transporter [Gammaproteobacteria bacterium]|nr:TDT family transporter [Gammaproteobacteria bacterium]